MYYSVSAASIAFSVERYSKLMTAITTSLSVVDEKLQQFWEKICQGQEEAAAKAVKWARYEKLFTSWKCGNEEQAMFNTKLEEVPSQAESDLSSIPIIPTTSSAFQGVKEALQKCGSLLEEQQMMIWLADCSNHG